MIPPAKRYLKFFWAVLILKAAALLLFSSDYQNRLFVPFIDHFLTNLDNPWQYFYKLQIDKFPYPPLMLYIISLFYLPYHLLTMDNVILQNLFFKLPILLSDILITYTLFKIFPNKIKEIFIFYFASPIVIYASYMHSQLDLVAVAILLFSIYLLMAGRILLSAVVFGLAISAKSHLVLVLPLVLIYIFKNYNFKRLVHFSAVSAAVYLIFVAPYILSEGYSAMVLRNPKQMMVFDSAYDMGGLKVYIPIFAALILYARFAAYSKVNDELFYCFIGILFAAFVFLIFPAYSWYVWVVPFLSLFFIEYYRKHPAILSLYAMMNLIYIGFFAFLYIPEYQDLIFIRRALNIKIHDEYLKNMVYTSFEVILCATVYAMYKFGVRSNSIYRKARKFIIGIAGDSAAGKTVLLSDIRLLLGERSLVLEGDADHRWTRDDERWQAITHLDPKANYLHRQVKDLFSLKFGESIIRGEYDHASGDFKPSRKIEPKEFILLSGLHTFYLPIARKIIDLKIYLDTEETLRQHWKVLRDMKDRGHAKEKVLNQIEKRIGDAEKFVRPQKDFADLVISYSPVEGLESGNLSSEPKLKLKVDMDSSIHLEKLVKKLAEGNTDVEWNYADNLKSQYIVLKQPPRQEMLEATAKEIIANMQELTAKDATWLDGYRGFVQLVVLLILSEKMQEASAFDEI